MLQLELEQWREALEKRGMKGSRANTEYMCLNGMPLGGVLCDKRVPAQVEGKIHKMIDQPAMLYGMETASH